MAKKMLIDATHPEETRVVVADGNKVEEFDFESLNKRQLAGNIYLAKVTRVEPSLQAAFVDYGGNRHGFLAFSEIHPDYYQIPKADRDALLAEERAYAEAQAAADEASDDDEAEADVDASDDADEVDEGKAEKPKKAKTRSRSRSRGRKKSDDKAEDEAPAAGDEPDEADTPGEERAPAAEIIAEGGEATEQVVSGSAADLSEAADKADEEEPETDDKSEGDTVTSIAEGSGLEDETISTEAETAASETPEPMGMETVDLSEDDSDDDTLVEEPEPRKSRSRSRRKPSARPEQAEAARDDVETVADDETIEDVRPARKPRPRKYKIQEVVKVRQIMLVQVVKEERGNKGAALTTYLSLAGRYCVLMPNTARGGGISRKITNAADRKKLKEIAAEIDVPQGAGLIVRTAGAKRTKTEIKRDYEYLQRQWEQVRELTLKSIAPAPIYEEGNLIHRTIRDLYSRDIDEVIVEGEAGYRHAKDYMKLIMPSHAKNVKLHPSGGQPLFAKYGVESYLASMFNPTVQLKSGGYIVIGITEALVAIDVNSGKSTKEGSIEETALKTNLEAADEVARQAKLRDLAGLIVIDFIDMDERRNNAAVEKRLKDALKNDRARIQVGRISGFGLLEMSRQRLRPGMLEATTQACPHCHGTGLIRSDDSVALQVLRLLEEEGTRKRAREVTARLPVKVANYLMNEKREHLAAIEQTYGMAVRIEVDASLIGDVIPPLDRSKTPTRQVPKPSQVVGLDTSWTSKEDEEDEIEEEDEPEEEEAAAEEQTAKPEKAEAQEEQPKKKRRRRSRRRKSNGDGGRESGSDASSEDGAATSETGEARAEPSEDAAEPAEAKAEQAAEEAPRSRSRTRSRRKKADPTPEAGTVGEVAEDASEPAETAPAEEEAKPKRRSRSRSRAKPSDAPEQEAEAIPADPQPEPSADAAPEFATEAMPEPATGATSEPEPEPEPEAKSKRTRARAKAPAPSEPVVEVAHAADAAMAETQEAEPEPEAEIASAPEAPAEPAAETQAESKPKRRGWWSFGT
ncbi:Rne/Rng family ribonuclease [Jannaschia formosa]|uniref:Rne/Rng family ribonuclease n=1 Tax=Jannaschia formosa TaxID=2259592 RepID=UPI000E1BDDBD|nr:Rne/Rng family ribonuclease [Jannaschia formosa]TFL17830.1 Rne/Rng family ribonuclease [Jannaschia formosa]